MVILRVRALHVTTSGSFADFRPNLSEMERLMSFRDLLWTVLGVLGALSLKRFRERTTVRNDVVASTELEVSASISGKRGRSKLDITYSSKQPARTLN